VDDFITRCYYVTLNTGGAAVKMNRKERRAFLQQRLEEDPFLADWQLAEEFQVSVATIRLDRMALGIPELRERARSIASSTYSQLRALQGKEVIGELIDIELGKQGISILVASDEMVFERSHIIRGHFLFAQGNSLAVAVVNSEMALTKTAHVRYYRPVKLDDRVVAKAIVTEIDGNHYSVNVDSRVQDELVFRGTYVVVDVANRGGVDRD
jgi:acyl-coenzyme A thioesterase PaaI-like protein